MKFKQLEYEKKAAIVFGIAFLIFSVVLCSYFNYRRNYLYTFEEITEGLSENVRYISTVDDEMTQKEIDELYNDYKMIHYIRSDVNKGDKMSELLFYDENNTLLFKIAKYRYSKIVVDINGKKIIYQTNRE